ATGTRDLCGVGFGPASVAEVVPGGGAGPALRSDWQKDDCAADGDLSVRAYPLDGSRLRTRASGSITGFISTLRLSGSDNACWYDGSQQASAGCAPNHPVVDTLVARAHPVGRQRGRGEPKHNWAQSPHACLALSRPTSLGHCDPGKRFVRT